MPSDLTGDWRKRIFVLGAGFSRPAGLPLAVELLDLVLDEVASVIDSASPLHRSLDQYRDYVRDTTGRAVDPVDLEAFVAYLDHEHLLGLRGSDTWSDEGNEDQCLLRWGIGRVLHRRTPTAADMPAIYRAFAERLRPGDVVITFNYDLVLEQALEVAGRAYRRFPHRYLRCGTWMSTIDSEADDGEVCVLKMHGSIDWVSRLGFERQQARMRETNGEQGAVFSARRDVVFGLSGCTPTRSLVEGPRPDADRLAEIDVIEDVDAYYAKTLAAYTHPPFLLAPAQTKQLYGEPIREFWAGFPRQAFAWGGLSIVGYSLPPADPYALQVLYQTARGYIAGRNDPDYLPGWMNKVVVVDFRQGRSSRLALYRRYRVLDRSHTRFLMEGFTEQSLDVLFAGP